MKTSARNVLKGRIEKITLGSVNAEVLIRLGGGEEIVSIISIESVNRLGLSQGKEVYAVVKASNVMVGVD